MAKKKPAKARKEKPPKAKDKKKVHKKEKRREGGSPFNRETMVIILLAVIIVSLVSYAVFINQYQSPGGWNPVYTSMQSVLDNPQGYLDRELLFTGTLRKLPALEEYLLEDSSGNTLDLSGMNFGNYELNRAYVVRGSVVSNEYCFCQEASRTYYWKPLGEIPQDECNSTGGQCILGTFYTDDNGTTLCECQIQDVLKSTYSDLGKMLKKECLDTQNGECKNTTIEYSKPYIIVTEMSAAA